MCWRCSIRSKSSLTYLPSGPNSQEHSLNGGLSVKTKNYLIMSMLALAVVLALDVTLALASRCSADARTDRFWDVTPNFKYKVKFTVSSSECQQYSCTGHIQFRSHFRYLTGGENGASHITWYTIPRGQSRADVVTDIIPSLPSLKINLQDIEVREVSCTTP